MATKRKRDDDKTEAHSVADLRTLLSYTITNYGSAEVALLHIMKTHNFDIDSLQQILTEDRIDISFSNVKYRQIAPFVGLQPGLNMDDIETFQLHRSRIPTALFKSIVQDIDVMLVHYGPPIVHETEEARSRFLSPIFNRLITVFGFAIRNLPESTIKGHITTKGRVEYYFKAIGSIAMLFIEIKLKIGSGKECLDSIAQVIAECDACDWNNTQEGIHVPIYGILCDGDVFEFFLFDGTTEPFSFKRGLGLNDPPTLQRPFRLPDPEDSLTTCPFINALRPICEIIFDLLLNGYVKSMEAYHNHSTNQSAKEGQPRKSADKWAKAMSDAIRALDDFREAEIKHQTQLTHEANSIVEVAMASLRNSVDTIPTLHRSKLIMSSWDDEEIETV